MPLDSKTWQKATALVPLALLSAGWTVMLSVAGADAVSSAPDPATVPVLPDPESIDAPASLASPADVRRVVPAAVRATSSSSSTDGIPALAFAAYQRAAQVMANADSGCGLSWPVIAAIGRVESDHGRYGGNVLSGDGVSTPGIIGIPLDGTRNTARIEDTDAGEYDHDERFDRAVGPMQFIPSTWSVVGVDGDGDKLRNPQDIDDAALATAVYLCAGEEDLRTVDGLDAAIFRYNHSKKYVALVKSIAGAYAVGDFSQVPTASYAPTYFGTTRPVPATKVSATGQVGSSTTPSAGNAQPPAAAPAAQAPAPETSTKPEPQKPAKTLEAVVTQVPESLANTVTELEKATSYCQSALTAGQLDALGGLAACTQAYLSGGTAALTTLLDGLGLGSLVGGLLGGK